MTALRPPHRRELTPRRAIQLRENLINEIERELQQASESPGRPARDVQSLRRVVAALTVTAIVATVFFFGVGPGDEPGAIPQIGQSSAKAEVEIVETDDAYEIVFVTLAEDVSEVEADLTALGLEIAIDFVPVSPSLENRLVAMSSPAEGENLPRFVESADGRNPSKLIVPKGFDQDASLIVGRPAQPGEEYVSAAVSAQLDGEALECLSVEGRTATEALPLVDDLDVDIEWRPDLTGESFLGVVPADYLGWYVAATVPVAQGRVLIVLVPDAMGFEGSTTTGPDC